jgi:hypothetical protein
MEYPLVKLNEEKRGERAFNSDPGNYGRQRRIDLEKLLEDYRKNFLDGKEIMVYTEDGYHYGVFQGLDEDFIYLANYVFDKQKLSVFEYSSRSGFSKGVIPREKMKAMFEIPLTVRAEKGESSGYTH